MSQQNETIAVVIAGYNAGDTITRSVRSALAQPEVSEVILVDDASTDDTRDKAIAAAGTDRRFCLLCQDVNRGPSAARNRAIAASSAPLIAVLDADDAFADNRFAALPAEADWDMWADNIRFVFDHESVNLGELDIAPERHCTVDFETFVEGNISSRKRVRGELGFLKPVIRRSLIERLNLRYAEDCRLGEDFLLYSEALAHGARFQITNRCGYIALRRDNSLSGRHRIEDLEALLRNGTALLRQLPLTPAQHILLTTHVKSIQQKISYREILRERRQEGVMKAIWAMRSRPSVLRDILLDKLRPPGASPTTEEWLLTDGDFARVCGQPAK